MILFIYFQSSQFQRECFHSDNLKRSFIIQFLIDFFVVVLFENGNLEKLFTRETDLIYQLTVQFSGGSFLEEEMGKACVL